MSTLTLELEHALAQLPVLDIHTHLVGGKLGARGLHDVLLYHMVVSDLYAAGCPSGARLTPYPAWPTEKEAHARIREALPFLPHIQNTSSWWGVRLILADLYGWREPITRDNWRRLDARIRERADDRAWHHSILDRLNIRRTGTEIARRERGQDDDRLQYALEWGFFTRCQWDEFDTALYELERCWGRRPESPSPIGAGGRPATERRIRSLADVHAAVKHYVEAIPYASSASQQPERRAAARRVDSGLVRAEQGLGAPRRLMASRRVQTTAEAPRPATVLATATHISTDIRFRVVGDAEMETALANRARAGVARRRIELVEPLRSRDDQRSAAGLPAYRHHHEALDAIGMQRRKEIPDACAPVVTDDRELD